MTAVVGTGSSVEDLEALRSSVRAFLADAVGESEVRRIADSPTGWDRALWARLAGELGLTGLVVPEEFGGSGAGFAELGVVLAEAGRALLPAPLFSTVALGVQALLLSGDAAAQAAHLPEVVAGRQRIAVGGLGTDPRCRAVEGPRGWLLEGTADRVLDGAAADLLLVFADADGSAGLFAVDATHTEQPAAGLSRTPLRTLDLTRRQARVELHATPATLVGTVGDGGRVSAALLDRALVAQAAEQHGGAQRVLEMSVEYARTRYQFGRAIGSFQAIKHRCADMLIDVERMAVAVDAALAAVDASSPDLPVAARVAASFCGEAYSAAAASTIQVHGGIGFTWEHPAHLYYRRAKSAELQFGSPAEHREALLRQLGH